MSAQSHQVSTAAEQHIALGKELEVLKPELAKVLPAHVSAEKFMRVVTTAIAQSPDLRSSDRRALLTACVKCATDGLVPDGREAALVMFSGKAQYMPMVAGILKKVRNSGELLSIVANVVYEHDQFRYFVDDVGEHVLHEPNVIAPDRGKLIAVYSIAKTKDGGVYVEVMSRSQIEQVRNVSKSKNNGPWVGWYDEMARKTVIRRLSKRLPMSTDLEAVVRRDDELYDLNQQRLGTGSGRDAAKAMLGLPILPDADDAAAADANSSGAPEGVDPQTGEVIEGNAEAFDEPKAIESLLAAKTLEQLNAAWIQIQAFHEKAVRDIPLAVEGTYDETKPKFGKKAK
ncbi:MAG TPA: recombinase RecT [Gammaproteobacteria bacterium]